MRGGTLNWLAISTSPHLSSVDGQVEADCEFAAPAYRNNPYVFTKRYKANPHFRPITLASELGEGGQPQPIPPSVQTRGSIQYKHD